MRLQKVHYLLLFPIFIVLSVGCSPLILSSDSSKVIQKEWPVDSFEAVNICCGIHLELTQEEGTQGEGTTITTEGSETMIDELEVFVRDNELIVQFRPRFKLIPRFNNRQITVYGTTPVLSAVTLSGGSQGKIDPLHTTDLQLSLSGGSQLVIDTVNVATVTSDLSGGSQLSVAAGTIEQQNANVSGGSRYLLEEVQSERADLDVSGGGQARIRVATTLHVDASGGSDIAFHGSPTLDQSISGGSRVRSLGD